VGLSDARVFGGERRRSEKYGLLASMEASVPPAAYAEVNELFDPDASENRFPD
jgi:hypothetical protein